MAFWASPDKYKIICSWKRSQLMQSTYQVIWMWQQIGSLDIFRTSDWKLSQEVFAKFCQKLGTPSINLFASQMSHQVPIYMVWKSYPGSQVTNAMYQPWAKMFPYAFLLFRLIPQLLSKQRKERITMILVAPTQ